LIECNIDPAAREAFLDKRILAAHSLQSPQQCGQVFLRRQSAREHRAKTCCRHARRPKAIGRYRRADHIQLLVRDSGIGIPKADLCQALPDLSSSFGNVGNRPGTGMGLVIVKQFVDLHRGTIRFESTEGKGTSVWVCLPIDSSEVGRAALARRIGVHRRAGQR
jgi:light-regulated signal transduction histidine kinase (bacteriophytochrome)